MAYPRKVGDDFTAQTAVETARDWTLRPAAKCGIIQRIIITDDEDYAVFEWSFGRGVTFPPPREERGA